jgi:phage tail sheath protein FI
MAVRTTYPGVYIEEIPSGVRPITGVATSIGAFVDYFARGPIDTAIQITSFADFQRGFGGLDTLSEASYALQQFFLNGGSQAWVVRVGLDAAAPNELAASTLVLEDAAAAALLRATAGERIRGDSVENPGTWGDSIRIEVDYDVNPPTDPLQIAAGMTVDELFNLTITEVAIQGGRQVPVRSETHRNLTLRPGMSNEALEVVNEASKLVQLSLEAALPDPFTAIRPTPSATVGGALTGAVVIPPDPSDFTLTPSGGGALTCTLTYGGTAPTDYPGLRPYLQAAIRAAGAAAGNASVAGATVQLWGKGTAGFPYRFVVLAGRGAAPFDPDLTLSIGGPAAVVGASGLRLSAGGVSVGPQQFSLADGGNGILPDAAAILGVQANKTGLFALEEADLFNILCIPRAGEIGATDVTEMQALMSTAIDYCEERRAFMVVDIPPTVTDPNDMQTWMAANDTLRHRNAAVYFPRPMIPDPLNGFRLRSVGPSGTLAGVYASTDAARGVWKAPAGTETRLRGASDLTYLLTDGENGVLNPLGINALRNFPVYGNVSWGARTLDGSDQQASEWKYIPVRRMALFLEESLYRGTKWVVFEPNDEPLWSQIRLNIGAFMQSLFRQGAFQGATPQQAYFVKCDGETTTQADIDLGIVNIAVGFAPLKPAEFVVIQIQQKAPEPLA